MTKSIRVNAHQVPAIVEKGHLVWNFNNDDYNVDLKVIGKALEFHVSVEAVNFNEQTNQWEGMQVKPEYIKDIINRLNPVLPGGRFLKDVGYKAV